MAFPKKFRTLLETKREQVSIPASVWLSYAVCGTTIGSCGWAGWIIESAVDENGTQLSAATEQVCEHCGKPLFRTEVALKVVPAANQTPPLILGRDYEENSIEYE